MAMSLALTFALGIIGGCSGEDAQLKGPAVADSAGLDGATASGKSGASSAPGIASSDTDGAKAPDKPVDSGMDHSDIVAANDAFRVFEPAEGAVVGTTFSVRGEARVFEAAFSYSLEDGHNILAEGRVMAGQGAPEWGKFDFTVTFEAATSPSGILIIYELSAKDGSPVNVLQLPVKFAVNAVKPIEEAK